MKEVVPKAKEPESESSQVEESITEVERSTQKKSRLDTDDDMITIPDDGKLWSKPLPEARETTRLVTLVIFCYHFICFCLVFREDEFEEYLQTLFF